MHRFLSALVLSFVSVSSFAGYAQASPPPNWTTSAGASYFKAASNESFTAAKTVLTSASLNVGGRAVTMPASLRLAANAGQFMARGLSLNPAWLLAGAAAPYLVEWVANRYFDTGDGHWRAPTTSLEFEWQIQNYGSATAWGATAQGVCTSTRAGMSYPSGPVNLIYWGGTEGQVGWQVGCGFNGIYAQAVGQRQVGGTDRILTPEQMADELDNSPFPQQLPTFYPDPVPVELPVLNPSADPVPVSQPLRVPQGEPQPVPNTNPQQYRTPVIDVKPSPTLAEPWRVDVTSKDITTESPAPLPDSQPVPQTDPAGTTSAVKDPDLCEKHPEILACAKPELDVPDADPVGNTNKDLAITADSGWGPSSGSCPASKTITVQGKTFTMGVGALCDFALMIRPLVLGFAWLSAALIFVGMGKRS